MALDPAIAQKLTELVGDINAKEQALADATDANNAAQSAAQVAVAQAASTAAAQTTAHTALSTSVDAMVEYVTGLK